ncbi:acetyltransferase [Paenibacillus algorifonticola]|uniref:acetyltransferase n=1 Tax=Paenibacillus algorifonticola TaxID=684063 RepID=UPI003D284E06
MANKVVVVGGGGHAKVIIDILQTSGNYEVVGFTSQSDKERSLCGTPYLGDDSTLEELYRSGIQSFFTAVGDNKIRRKIFDRLVEMGFKSVNAISPFACVSSYATIGEGVIIMPGAIINAYACIGDNVIINTKASVDHDCCIGSHVHIAPGSTIAGSVSIGEGTFIGAGSTLIPGIEVGGWSVIGAGSVVISNIPSNVKVVGVPAKKYINKDGEL